MNNLIKYTMLTAFFTVGGIFAGRGTKIIYLNSLENRIINTEQKKIDLREENKKMNATINQLGSLEEKYKNAVKGIYEGIDIICTKTKKMQEILSLADKYLKHKTEQIQK